MDLGASARRLSQPQTAHIAWQAWATAARERRAIAILWSSFGCRAGTRGARGALDGVVGIVVLYHIALASAASAACNTAIIRPTPVRRWGLNSVVKRRPGRGMNSDQYRGAYIFRASLVVLIVAFLVNWWLAA